MRDKDGHPLPTEIRDRQAMFDACPDLLKRGRWIRLNIEPNIMWPVRPQSLIFAGHEVWIIPITTDDHPGVAMRQPEGMQREDAEGLLLRLLSVIAWRENAGIAVAYRTGGDLPRMMGLNKKSGFVIRDAFDFTDVICPDEEEPRIALALMREARSLTGSAYAFLSYWRILEITFPKSAERIPWMQAKFANLDGHGVKEAFDAIRAAGIADVGRHLFDSGRCAIAHAQARPIINPDNPRDTRRLMDELPIVRELAVLAIEERFGIDTRNSEYRKHLYELKGWKCVLGEAVIERIIRGEEPAEGDVIDLPVVNFRLYETPPYDAFERMAPSLALTQDRKLILQYSDAGGLISLRFALNFIEERLEFDVSNGVYGRDDGSVLAAERSRDSKRLFRDYLLNGIVEIWDADTGDLLGRLDAFLPLNCFVDLDACNREIATAEAEIERRTTMRN